MTRGRDVCSVANEDHGARGRTTDKKSLLKIKSIERMSPIGMKFAHHSKGSGKSEAKKLSNAEKWVAETCELGVRGIRKEFVSDIRNYVPEGTQSAWEDEENIEKNRYDDVRLLDKTRVILKDTPDHSDYIHASYVHLDDGMSYICAQGPMQNTVEAFWIMVLQEDAKVVLQLCQTIEEGKEKCFEYIPTKTNENFGAVKVTVLDKPSNVLSLKNVKRSKLKAEYKGKANEIWHIFYSGWPDHVAADSPAVCREVRQLVHKYYGKKPIVAHCSAGIGRTGTFVAIEIAMQRLEKNQTISMSDISKELRNQRLGAIQTDQVSTFIERHAFDG
ncbi:hypothetical protein AB6A40_004560 [Gnathostoma spinigerum]|uniref:Protein tyrosine phosphatase n=1 Tax=Gnathostoma spinigerum TaxID=75299 RepID=A0ABD6EF52_9BILA